MRILVQLIFDSLVYSQADAGAHNAENPATKSKYLLLVVDIRTFCMRNLHTQRIERFVPGILRNQYSKLLFIWLFYFRCWFISFIVVQGFLAIFIGTFSFVFSFSPSFILSLSLFSSSENRSSFEFIRSLPRQTRPLSFLAFSGSSFSGKYLRQLGWKSNRFHRYFLRWLILLLTFYWYQWVLCLISHEVENSAFFMISTSWLFKLP
jgi:hypothetical protein